MTTFPTLQLWTFCLTYPNSGNPPARVNIISNRKPTYEEVKRLWKERAKGCDLVHSPEDIKKMYQYYIHSFEMNEIPTVGLEDVLK